MTLQEKLKENLDAIDCDGCEYECDCDGTHCIAEEKEIDAYVDEMDHQYDLIKEGIW